MSLGPFGEVTLTPNGLTPEMFRYWQVRRRGVQGCDGCQNGLGFTMPNILEPVKGWFEGRGMDWRLGLGVAALAIVSFVYMGANRPTYD